MIYGLDIGKNISQPYSLNPDTGEVLNHKLSVIKRLGFFANRTPCRIVLEASGSAHWRALQAHGGVYETDHARRPA